MSSTCKCQGYSCRCNPVWKCRRDIFLSEEKESHLPALIDILFAFIDIYKASKFLQLNLEFLSFTCACLSDRIHLISRSTISLSNTSNLDEWNNSIEKALFLPVSSRHILTSMSKCAIVFIQRTFIDISMTKAKRQLKSNLGSLTSAFSIFHRPYISCFASFDAPIGTRCILAFHRVCARIW